MTLTLELSLAAGGYGTRSDGKSALAAQYSPPNHLPAGLGVGPAKLEVHPFGRGGSACHPRLGRATPSIDELGGVLAGERRTMAVIDLCRHSP